MVLTPYPNHFIFEIKVGKRRIRHRTTLNLNDLIFSPFWVYMSDTPLSDFDFKKRLGSVLPSKIFYLFAFVRCSCLVFLSLFDYLWIGLYLFQVDGNHPFTNNCLQNIMTKVAIRRGNGANSLLRIQIWCGIIYAIGPSPSSGISKCSND